MSVVREEILGPVVCATPFSDPDEIVAAANDSSYGLAAAWIAATAIAHGADLLTQDGDFDAVPSLRVIKL